MKISSSKPFGVSALFLALLFTSSLAQAEIIVQSVTGYSNIELGNAVTGDTDSATDENASSKFHIYGGMAGDDIGECASPSASETCNNCTTELAPCNMNRVHPGLELTINFTAAKAGDAILETSDDNPVATGTSGLSGDTFSVTATWGEICSAIGDPPGSTCSSSFTKSFKIGIDEDRDGDIDGEERSLTITVQTVDKNKHTFHTNCDLYEEDPEESMCQFTVYPGDRKVHITEINGDRVLTGPNSLKYTGVQIFFEAGDFSDVTPASDSEYLRVKEVGENEIELVTKTINGLKNGVQYAFRMANVDEAGNIFLFSRFNDEAPKPPDPKIHNATQSYLNDTDHKATPDEVMGVLDDELSCFIATAAYGSPFESKVADLRAFRNRFLNSHPIGRSFVETYYKLSPPLAAWINQSEARKAVVRVALWPAWAISKSFLWLSNQLFPQAQAQEIEEMDFIELELEEADDLFDAPTTTEAPKDDGAEEFEEIPAEEAPMDWALPELQESAPPVKKEGIKAQTPPPAPLGPAEKRIKHPGASKGLTRIDRDGAYYYRTDASPETNSISVKLGQMQPPEIISHDSTVAFTDVYGDSPLTALWVDYEWPWITSFGKFGVKFSTGFISTSGKGLLGDSMQEALEEYSFMVIPTVATVGYRMQLSATPILVPYAEAGAGTFNIAEIRDDGADNKFAYSPVITTTVGAMFSLTRWHRQSAFELDSEYGINNIWLDIAFKRVQALNLDLDLSSNLIHAGITVDY